MDKNRNTVSLVVGAILVVLGVVFLFGRLFNILNMDDLWPLILAGIGSAFLVAVLVGDNQRTGLAVPGCILVTIGLMMFLMNLTDNWEAWSYCWALIISAVGAGVWINGYRSDQPELRKRGRETIRTGLILFVIFAVIMEFIFTLSGEHRQVNSLVWSILLSILGLFLLASRLLRLGKPGGERLDLFWPVMMIGVGGIAFLYQLDVIPAANLNMMLNLWPLLLIVAGVGILFHNRTPWIGAILGLLVVGGMLIVGFYGAQLGLPSRPAWSVDFGSINIGGGEERHVIASGNRISEIRPVVGVKQVELAIPADLSIRQGPVEELTIEADENVMPVLTTEVRGGKLTIRYSPQVDVDDFRTPQMILTVKDLTGVKVSSSGSVVVSAFSTGDIDIDLSSSGKISFQELQARTISVLLSSSGDITIKGKADELRLDVSSSGSFQAGDLEIREADINLSSSGEITVWVTRDLQVRISSSGDIYYYGNPTVRQNNTSSGELTPLGDK